MLTLVCCLFKRTFTKSHILKIAISTLYAIYYVRLRMARLLPGTAIMLASMYMYRWYSSEAFYRFKSQYLFILSRRAIYYCRVVLISLQAYADTSLSTLGNARKHADIEHVYL